MAKKVDIKSLVEEYQNESAENRKDRLEAQKESTKTKIADLKKYGELELSRKIAEWQKARNALVQQIANSGGVQNPRNSSLVEQLSKVISDLNSADETLSELAGGGKVKTGGRPKGVPKEAKFNSVTGNWESGDQKWDSSGQAVVETKTRDKKKPSAGAGDTTPQTPGKTVAGDFSAGTFRQADEASMGNVPAGATVTKTGFDKIMAEAVKLYGGIDEIFATDEELKNLLTRAIGDVTTARDDMDEDQFINLLQNTTWFKSNAGPIRQRGFEKRQYDALVKKIKTDDPNYKQKIEQLNQTSSYGRGLQDVIELLRENATRLGRQVSDEDLRIAAQGIYDLANEDDAVKIRNAVLGIGSFGLSTGKDGQGIAGLATGAAGQNLTTLRAVAAANGMDLDKMFGSSINTWLDRLAKGESIETFKNIIRQTAKSGLPETVGKLLDQGVDLDTIYDPYRKLMSAVLEINPETITLNDPTLRMGIGPDKEISLYEYQRMLRKDPRWQYTNNAREDVSNSALTVLRNFGFQG